MGGLPSLVPTALARRSTLLSVPSPHKAILTVYEPWSDTNPADGINCPVVFQQTFQV
jgi:hypothetical protein